MERSKLLFLTCWGYAILALSSCSSREWTLIRETEVYRLLPKYAMLTANLQNRGDADSIRQASYQNFFTSEGYTLEDWDSSMMWYAKNNMPLYHDFYRVTSSKLSQETELLQQKSDSVAWQDEVRRKRLGYIIDSVNLLDVPSQIYRTKDFVNLSFNFQPIEPYSQVDATISVGIFGLPILSDSNAWELRLNLCNADSFLVTEGIKIQGSGIYKISRTIDANLSINRVSGYLRGIVPKLSKSKVVYVDSLRLHRYRSTEQATPEDKMVAPLTETEVLEGTF